MLGPALPQGPVPGSRRFHTSTSLTVSASGPVIDPTVGSHAMGASFADPAKPATAKSALVIMTFGVPAGPNLMITMGGYSPRQTGWRFSANAAAPSIASADVNTGPAIPACRSNASDSGQSADSATIRLVAASDRGALRPISAASARAWASASPAGTR